MAVELRQPKTCPGLTQLGYCISVSISFLDILRLFIFQRRLKELGLMLWACVAHSSAIALMWGVLATDDVGKVCPQIFWGTRRSEGACHTSRQSPAAQRRSFWAVDPPEIHQGCPGSCVNVRVFKERSGCSFDFGCRSLNHVKGGRLWNSSGPFMLANPRLCNWLCW